MKTGRLEAFSDGVLAIILTIMVLEMKVPRDADKLIQLRPMLPVFLSYVLSFIYIAIYWNNHHHLLYAATHISGRALWANQHLLFWLSLVPFVTGWMGENNFAPAPTALYGFVMLMAALAYWILQRTILATEEPGSVLRRALRNDLKGNVSLLIYAVAIPLAYFSPWIAGALYALVAAIWLVPDTRIEKQLEERRPHRPDNWTETRV
jgi:uncharacterized membrane protein